MMMSMISSHNSFALNEIEVWMWFSTDLEEAWLTKSWHRRFRGS